jgi:dihydroneopterin aldolase
MHRDQLCVEGLRVRCMLGGQRPLTMALQDALVSFTLYLDLSTAGRSDERTDTVDLVAVAASVRRYAECTRPPSW